MTRPLPVDSSLDEVRETLHRQMLSTVSHDLKTPLATIIGSLEIYTRMDDRLTPEKRHTLINSALTEAYRLDGFISNILDMAKLEGGLVKTHYERADLSSIVHDALIRLGPKREKGKISVIKIGELQSFNIDPNLVGRALILLIDNALKHAGKEPVIMIKHGVDDDGMFMTVEDNGPGIPRGEEESIFCKYTRLAKSDHNVAGTGLGLAICRAIMRVLSGQVSVRNKPEGGALFILRFPRNGNVSAP